MNLPNIGVITPDIVLTGEEFSITVLCELDSNRIQFRVIDVQYDTVVAQPLIAGSGENQRSIVSLDRPGLYRLEFTLDESPPLAYTIMAIHLDDSKEDR